MNRPLRQVPTIRAIPWILGGTALFLAGCDAPSPPERLPSTVRAQVATSTSRAASVTLTGEIKARVQSDLAFRFSGRIASRTVTSATASRPGRFSRRSRPPSRRPM